MTNLTPEETGALTGEDVEDIRDEEHPQGSLDEDMEGTGVDEPNLDAANWDDEIEPEDRDDNNLSAIKNWGNITEEDREFYLKMVNLRRAVKEGISSQEIESEADKLVKDIQLVVRDARGDRDLFLAMVNNKLVDVVSRLSLLRYKQKRVKR